MHITGLFEYNVESDLKKKKTEEGTKSTQHHGNKAIVRTSMFREILVEQTVPEVTRMSESVAGKEKQ